MSFLGLYLLLCAPGMIVALLVRLWARRRKLSRNTRAWLVGATIGLLCSPGVYVGMYGMGAIVPSLLAAVMTDVQRPRMWLIFLASSAFTTIAAYGVYMLLSKSRGPKAQREKL